METPNGPPQPWEERHRDEATHQARVRLGAALRKARESASLSTRQVPKAHPGEFYSSTQISHVESGKAVPSPELIESYITIGGDSPHLRSLYQQALAAANNAGRRRRGGTAAEVRPPRDALLVADRLEVQQHYVVVAAEAHYRFSPAGAIAEVDCVSVLRAKVPGVRLAYSGYSYPVEQRKGVLSVAALAGARVADVRESGSGALGCYWELDRELDPSDPEPHLIEFRVTVDSTVRAMPRLRYFAYEGNERVTVTAAFPAPVSPSALWWFGALDPIDAEYQVRGREMTVDETGRYRRTFDAIVPGWTYGLAWTW